MSNNVLIWGAGRIGRGFAAEIFKNGGYDLCFWDKDETLLAQLREKKQYTLYKLNADNQEKIMMDGYRVFLPSEETAFKQYMCETDLVALAVFPAVFADVAKKLAEIIELRAQKGIRRPIDIIVFSTVLHVDKQVTELLQKEISPKNIQYFKEYVGVCSAIVLSMAVNTTPEMQAEDSLVVATNGYPDLIVDGAAFRGQKPDCPHIVYPDRYEAWEIRKLYSYNMMHALLAYTGVHRGHQYVAECTQDGDIRTIADGALAEVGLALQKTYGFTAAEMENWDRECMGRMGNPNLHDLLTRVGADPVRKLKAGDRLAGAALLCKKSGILPYYITKAMAYGFLYNEPEDPSAGIIHQYVQENGIKAAAIHFCGFETEPELAQLITDRYNEVLADPDAGLKNDERLVEIYKKAWDAGFKYESTVKGCAQCTLLAERDVQGIFDEKVFEAATSYSAGMGMCGDGACGGYSGGLMTIGLYSSRNLEDLETKNKVGQYRSFELGQKLHDSFAECYGGILCKDVHMRIFGGKAYALRYPEQKEAFEAAGGHLDKCNAVVAMSQYLIARVLEQDRANGEK